MNPSIQTEIEQLIQYLYNFGTTVRFTKNSLRDYKSYDKGQRKAILALLVKQAQKGADFQPDGNGHKLDPPLHQFAKIKPHAMSLRIVYRPVKVEIDNKQIVEMQIIAIGPKDKEEVYKLAKKRLPFFLKEMGK